MRKLGTLLNICIFTAASGGIPVDEETWSYFTEIALQAEYQEIEPVTRKWTDPIIIRIFGEPLESDLIALAESVRELRDLSENRLQFRFVADSEFFNLGIYFIHSSEFSRHAPIPSGKEVRGYFVLRWREDYSFSYGTILIANNEELTAEQRLRLLREELTQAMGLLNDSDRYPESIFYRNWSESHRYSERDRQLIRMLYAKGVEPGMDEASLRSHFALPAFPEEN